MSKLSWRVRFGLVLVALTAVLLYIHSVVFHDMHEFALFFGTHEIAMMPLEVLVVTMIFHSLLEKRAHREKLHKLHMVIGAFFSEVGAGLLKRVADLDAMGGPAEHFRVDAGWGARRFEQAKAAAASHDYRVDAQADDLKELKSFLVSKRQFLLALLQNPTLLEHESFTEALWAVFHLTEELEQRTSLDDLPESDRVHLVGDVTRAYGATAAQWLDHARHLQEQYPYLFSLAVRSNPLDPSASVTVTG